MSVHYRFKSALDYDTITFDGLHISVKDLKNAIIQQKRIGKSTDFDLKITNAQTQEEYEDENALIPKNTSLLIARVPVSTPKQKQWEGYGGNDTPPSRVDEVGPIGKAMDLASLDAPEDDKIKAMMSQSTQDYDPSNYVKIRGANQVGPVPPSYRCYKCHTSGHWIKDCPFTQGTETIEIKKSTGIPQSFMVPVEGPQVPGAMMMSNGQYAVPALDLQAHNQKPSAPAPVPEQKTEIPDDLLCSICSDLLADAVMIPCCGNSFCDECIRSVLLESDDHECPDCHEKDISPATLIPNRFLRKSVANFKNTTGYEKKPIYRPKPVQKEEPPKKETTPPPAVDSTEKENLNNDEKTVISEADSTEHAKRDSDFAKDIDLEQAKTEEVEGPPGVSPKNSPIRRITRDRDRERDRVVSKPVRHRRSRSPSPRRSRVRKSPNFETRRSSEKHGTPTRDEPPPGIGPSYPPPNTVDSFRGPPRDMLRPVDAMIPTGPPPMVHQPGGMPRGSFPPPGQPQFHSTGAPPPNFRLPPPGAPPPYMPPGSFPGPRPLFDPMRAPPGNYGQNYPDRPRGYGGGRRGRERTPPGIIDDPLAAFNRILKEKDEKRARQQRLAARRSWSRSHSRSRSFSRSPPPLRRRSRSPRRRLSRSRSRSFSKGRSRSRSFSPSPGRGLSPLRRSPPPLQSRRGALAATRYRSPIRSPPARRRNDRERTEYDRGVYRDKARGRRSTSRDRFYDDRGRDFDRGVRNRVPPPVAPAQPVVQPQWTGPRDGYYPPPQDQVMAHSFHNRFPQQIHHIQPDRKYEQIAPPEVEQPPVPGLESEPPPVNEFEKQKKSPIHKERDGHSSKDRDGRKEKDREHDSRKDHESRREHDARKEHEPRKELDTRDRRDRERDRDKDRRRSDKRSRSRTKTPEKHNRNLSPGGTPERPKRRRISSESKDEKRKDRHHLEDDKKKNKDKKKHREKKDEKKKRKEKKDKSHKSKDKKDKKEEFKQVIPKGSGGSDEDSDEVRKKIEEKRKAREEEEKRKLEEERKKEERRIRFIEDEKRRKEEEAKKEEAKRRSIEEARKLLDEEERARKLEAAKKEEEQKLQKEQEFKHIMDLYDEVIPEKDLSREIREDFIDPQEFNIHVPVQEELVSIPTEEKEVEDGEVTDDTEMALVTGKEKEDEDLGILELHSDMDIKLDENDILAPMPEKSKWEVEEATEPAQPASIDDFDIKEISDSKSKVSSEVIKRAENVIFARAINSIRPHETKKGPTEQRIKIHIDDKPIEERHVEIPVDKPVEKPRLSVKERLGKKVDEPDPKVNLIDIRGGSPFSRRERRIEVEAHRKHDRRHSKSTRDTSRDKHRIRHDKSSDKNIRKHRKDDKERYEDKIREKHKRTRSRSPSEEQKKKRKEKKVKKEKLKKHHEEPKKEETKEENTPKSAVEKRKPTLDEANFEPDYDLELHDDETELEKESAKKDAPKSDDSDDESSSSESTSSSTEEDRKKKKRKAKKKKRRRDSSSSESESSSDSSDSDRDRKRKKHKKTKKKKKKPRHK